MMKYETDTFRDLVDVLSGPIVWFAHFGCVYGAQAMLCTLGYSEAIPWVVLWATVAALGVLGWIVFAGVSRSDRLVPRPDGEHQDFMAYLEYSIAFVSAISVAWVAVSAAFLPACQATIG